MQQLIKHDLQVADVPALGRDEQVERGRRRSTTRTPWPAGCRPRCCTTRSTGRPARRRRLPGLPPGTRAAQLVDSNVHGAGRLPRPVRQAAARERLRVRALQRHACSGPVLNLVNGPVVADAIHDPANRITKLAAAEKDDAKVVEELYLSILSRLPTQGGAEDRRARPCKATTTEHAKLVAERKRREAALAALREAAARAADGVGGERQRARRRGPCSSRPTLKSTAGEPTLTKQADGSILVTGTEPDAGDLHGHGRHEAARHHRHPPGGAARRRACPPRARAAPPTATSC